MAILVTQVKSTPDISGILRCARRVIQFSMREITVIDMPIDIVIDIAYCDRYCLPTAICEYWGKSNHNMSSVNNFTRRRKMKIVNEK